MSSLHLENYSTLKISPEKSQILICDSLVANERYVSSVIYYKVLDKINTVDLTDRWCQDVVRCSKIGCSVVCISQYTAAGQVFQFLGRRFIVSLSSGQSQPSCTSLI